MTEPRPDQATTVQPLDFPRVLLRDSAIRGSRSAIIEKISDPLACCFIPAPLAWLIC